MHKALACAPPPMRRGDAAAHRMGRQMPPALTPLWCVKHQKGGPMSPSVTPPSDASNIRRGDLMPVALTPLWRVRSPHQKGNAPNCDPACFCANSCCILFFCLFVFWDLFVNFVGVLSIGGSFSIGENRHAPIIAEPWCWQKEIIINNLKIEWTITKSVERALDCPSGMIDKTNVDICFLSRTAWRDPRQ